MRLKKLIVQGFKSFYNRTEFEFTGGITGLVDPNGCGKSNVVDAIRWVLGEQRAKQLRGNEMADIIFSGTDRRKPLGFAEAMLVFDNTDRSLPHDLDEVTVGRRLFRSGDSEYLLNNKQVRLRDIRELFMDTGFGATSYSIIEQGAVAFLLTAGKKERRQIFEEAAGISKYKARKKQAEAKLERAEQSLLRVRDIIEEVEKRLRSVRTQASRAARFKKYSEELRELRMVIYSRDCRQLSDRLEVNAQRAEREGTRRSSVQSNLANLDAGSSDISLKIGQVQEKLQGHYQRRAQLNTQLEVTAEQLRSLEERLIQIDQSAKDASRQIQTHEAKQEDVADRITQTRERIEVTRNALEEARDRMAKVSAALDTARMRLREAHSAVESLRKDSIAQVQQETQISNRLAVKETEFNSSQSVIDRLGMKSAEIATEIEQLEIKKTELEKSAAQTRGQLEASETELAQVGHQLDDLVARIDDERQEASVLREGVTRKESRREVLQGLEARREGITGVVRKLLDEAKAGRLQGIQGIVADYVEVESGYAKAIEVLLGDRAQAVVTDTVERAVALGREARANNRTGIRFLPRQNDATEFPSAPLAPEARKGIEVLRGDPEAIALVSRMVGGALIVETVEKAVEVFAATKGTTRIATLGGDLIDTDGSLVVGLAGDGVGLISRRGELKELTAQIAERQAALTEKEEQIAGLREQLKSLKESQVTLSRTVNDLRNTVVQTENTVGRTEDRCHHLSEQRTVTDTERKDLEARLSDFSQEITQLRAKRDELAQKRTQLDDNLKKALENESQLAESMRSDEAELSASRVATAQHGSEHEGLVRSLDMLERSLSEHRETITHLKTSIEQGATIKERTRQDIANAQTRREQARTELAEVGQTTGELEGQRDALRQELAQNEAIIKQDREDLHEIEQILHSLDLEHQELGMKLESLTTRAREEYDIELAEYSQNFVEDEERNWDEMEARAEELAGKIKRIGPVNLDALDEMAELEIRAEQLKTQEADVLKAIGNLKEIIRRNNQICVERFSTVFQEIRLNFHDMFRKLFGSGRADIILDDPENILECGIEIMAKPPGKEPAALSLISGGEKAMTAVALLFAIFKTKPSPFCIMDEVDAPLDESNIERFVGVLRDHVGKTQFLVITHSKRTMAMSDCLYGVTMEEPGVSKRVTVNFEQAENAPEKSGGTLTGMHVRMSDRQGIKVDTFEVDGEKNSDDDQKPLPAEEANPAKV